MLTEFVEQILNLPEVIEAKEKATIPHYANYEITIHDSKRVSILYRWQDLKEAQRVPCQGHRQVRIVIKNLEKLL